MNSDMVAAASVATTIRDLLSVVCFGIGSAGTVLLGKSLGEKRMDKGMPAEHDGKLRFEDPPAEKVCETEQYFYHPGNHRGERHTQDAPARSFSESP
mgnify:CR=1 FL=1